MQRTRNCTQPVTLTGKRFSKRTGCGSTPIDDRACPRPAPASRIPDPEYNSQQRELHALYLSSPALKSSVVSACSFPHSVFMPHGAATTMTLSPMEQAGGSPSSSRGAHR